MKKLTKSLIAAAAGTALLLGGGGTLAAWNSGAFASVTTTISAGDLSLTAPSAGTWTDQTGTTVTLDTFRVAPGDTLTYETTMDLTARGDNLQGTLALDPASISPANPAKAEDVALAARLTKSASVTVDGRTSAAFTAKPGSQTIRVTTTVTWPGGNAPATDNTSMRGSVTLNNMKFTVTQTQP
ncbi:alternate-type signal peptide domain-containing protein [Leucobacter viscericola]|uniref:Alternate-type signal peptide domain-containing protein n=1 Tax=Leucobacter viscericola TaxID=2714935 RepID=A0A6G7XFH2_9MICO|nr:alternate-type signal peptide domain-containing protein [Leucobacter viscericola]QIK63344.1 alternate-type signal peptide domain-containing protein [Leucobacter viscericola]